MIDRPVLLVRLMRRGILEIEQGLMGELGDYRIRMPQQPDQQPQPRQFIRFDSYHW